MKYRFRSNEDKWTKVMEIADRKQDEIEALLDEMFDEMLDTLIDTKTLTVENVADMLARKRKLEVKETLDDLAGMGALVTSIDKNTGETLYRYDNTNPRARTIMAALGSHEVTRVFQ
jgi:hypothetical protein